MMDVSILVVDDQPDCAESLADVLRTLDYRVDVAFDGAAALRFATEHRYDFALLDYQMPKMNGDEIYRKLSELQPCLVAVMITAFAGQDGVKKALDAGTWRVLKKPVEVVDLISLLGTAAKAPMVLVVDDDFDFASSVQDILRDQGFRVCVAQSVSEAQARADQVQFDVVLLDLQFPGEHRGMDVVELQAKMSQNSRVILVTAHADSEHQQVQVMKSQGLSDVFAKPIQIEELIERIKGGRYE